MRVNKKTTGTLTVGTVVLIAVIVGSKLLGGPDLTGLIVSDAPADGLGTVEHEPYLASRSTPEPGTREGVEPLPQRSAAGSTADGESAIRNLIDTRTSGQMVELHAEVVKVLPDDNEGSRHQRLLLKLETGGTVLVAHNIDLAERVPVAEHEWITVYGQYEWNDKGGVLHWTHHDPKDWREGGWIEHAGLRYE